MGLKRTAILIVVAVWGTAIGFGFPAVAAQAGAAVQQQTGGERKIWEGVYTQEQADRGKPRFDASCSRCHNLELIGSDRGPALKGTAFLTKYENDSLASVYTLMRDTMPRD